jgi:hypothetical protein
MYCLISSIGKAAANARICSRSLEIGTFFMRLSPRVKFAYTSSAKTLRFDFYLKLCGYCLLSAYYKRRNPLFKAGFCNSNCNELYYCVAFMKFYGIIIFTKLLMELFWQGGLYGGCYGEVLPCM